MTKPPRNPNVSLPETEESSMPPTPTTFISCAPPSAASTNNAALAALFPLSSSTSTTTTGPVPVNVPLSASTAIPLSSSTAIPLSSTAIPLSSSTAISPALPISSTATTTTGHDSPAMIFAPGSDNHLQSYKEALHQLSSIVPVHQAHELIKSLYAIARLRPDSLSPVLEVTTSLYQVLQVHDSALWMALGVSCSDVSCTVESADATTVKSFDTDDIQANSALELDVARGLLSVGSPHSIRSLCTNPSGNGNGMIRIDTDQVMYSTVDVNGTSRTEQRLSPVARLTVPPLSALLNSDQSNIPNPIQMGSCDLPIRDMVVDSSRRKFASLDDDDDEGYGLHGSETSEFFPSGVLQAAAPPSIQEKEEEKKSKPSLKYWPSCEATRALRSDTIPEKRPRSKSVTSSPKATRSPIETKKAKSAKKQKLSSSSAAPTPSQPTSKNDQSSVVTPTVSKKSVKNGTDTPSSQIRNRQQPDAVSIIAKCTQSDVVQSARQIEALIPNLDHFSLYVLDLVLQEKDIHAETDIKSLLQTFALLARPQPLMKTMKRPPPVFKVLKLSMIGKIQERLKHLSSSYVDAFTYATVPKEEFRRVASVLVSQSRAVNQYIERFGNALIIAPVRWDALYQNCEFVRDQTIKRLDKIDMSLFQQPVSSFFSPDTKDVIRGHLDMSKLSD